MEEMGVGGGGGIFHSIDEAFVGHHRCHVLGDGNREPDRDQAPRVEGSV